MKKGCMVVVGLFMVFALTFSANAFVSEDTAKKLSDVLMKAPAENHWQVKADDVFGWMQAKKTDFFIVDVRPNPPGLQGGKIAGSLYIPYHDILKAENLKKLPKDKKVVLVCVTGQTQNLPILALRALGYNAYTMSFGYASWIKGYLGAQLMQQAIQNANTKNFPVQP